MGALLEEAVSLPDKKSYATITTSDAARDCWDAIVIGAGPAGAVAARQLARASKLVLLVERHTWPREKACGGCLNQRALAALSELGLDDAARFASPASFDRVTVNGGRQSVVIPLPPGVAINRGAFDNALVRAAIETGAMFLPQTSARVLSNPQDGRHREVELHQSGRPPVSVTARIVLAADGLGHPSLDHLPEFCSAVSPRSRIGLAATLDDPEYELHANGISMAVSPAGYVGLVRTADGRLNLAAAVDRDALRHTGGPRAFVAQVFAKFGRSCPALPEEVAWHGTPPLTRSSARLIHDRIALVGDAAGYVEPFTGEGIAWAITSAVLVSQWAVAGMAAWNATVADSWDHELRREMRRNQLVCRLLAGALRRPWILRGALQAVRLLPGVARPWVRWAQA